MNWLALLLALALPAAAQEWGGTLRFALRSEPKTFQPNLVTDESSETIRYLTGGVLIRMNRYTQELEPQLAVSWKVSDQGKTITFRLRGGVQFSDGTPFTVEDVVFTFGKLMDPAIESATADSFRSTSEAPKIVAVSGSEVAIHFATAIAGVERLFDQVVIQSARSPKKEMAVLGPFAVREYKAGSYVLLERNVHYWQKDKSGRALPYLDGIRLDIQQNRELELMRFRRGELHFINRVDPDMFARLAVEAPGVAKDAGSSLESDFLWFNQMPAAPLPAHTRQWFQSKEFRRAVSAAINRGDLCRVVYHGFAKPAAAPISPANRVWFDASLVPQAYDPAGAMARLQRDGFRSDGKVLRDHAGNAVEFSIMTNAGNKSRERMAAMIQQDLAKIGIKLNIVTLDFASLIERMTKTFQYEACLLGFVNVDLDPNGQMNVWLSSGGSHQWNPNQKTPATPWEAEIDKRMREQASTLDPARRKAAFDKVQEIAWEEAPLLYLVTKNTLVAVGPTVRNLQVAPLHPQVYWNAERLYLAAETGRGAP